jgi:hypothetical protein
MLSIPTLWGENVTDVRLWDRLKNFPPWKIFKILCWTSDLWIYGLENNSAYMHICLMTW